MFQWFLGHRDGQRDSLAVGMDGGSRLASGTPNDIGRFLRPTYNYTYGPLQCVCVRDLVDWHWTLETLLVGCWCIRVTSPTVLSEAGKARALSATA